jgi:DNA-binding CsgD family transcriptional regulator
MARPTSVQPLSEHASGQIEDTASLEALSQKLRRRALDILEEAIRAADTLAASMRSLNRPVQAEVYEHRADYIRQRLEVLLCVLEDLDGLTAGPDGGASRRDGHGAPGRCPDADDDDEVVSSALLERSLDALAAEFELTRREREVAGLLVRGLSNRDIAEQLVIAQGTAANHVQRVLIKLGCRNRAQVILMAVRHDPVHPDGAP